MSDTVSISSNLSADASVLGGIIVEEVGQLQIADFVPKRMVLLNYTLAALSEDGKLMLGEIRTRGGDDWALAGRSVVALNAKYSEERR